MAFGPNPPPIQVHLCVKGGDDAIAFYEKAFGGYGRVRDPFGHVWAFNAPLKPA